MGQTCCHLGDISGWAETAATISIWRTLSSSHLHHVSAFLVKTDPLNDEDIEIHVLLSPRVGGLHANFKQYISVKNRFAVVK